MTKLESTKFTTDQNVLKLKEVVIDPSDMDINSVVQGKIHKKQALARNKPNLSAFGETKINRGLSTNTWKIVTCPHQPKKLGIYYYYLHDLL
jgi:hypothetical protein